MKVVPLESSTLSVSELVELAQREPVILIRSGEPLAALRDIAGSDWESTSIAKNPRFQTIIEDSRRAYHDEGGVGIDELRAELGLDGPSRSDASSTT